MKTRHLLLNPAHAGFAALQLQELRPLQIDGRLLPPTRRPMRTTDASG